MTEASHPLELEVLQYPHPVLRQRAEPVVTFDRELAGFCAELQAAMTRQRGVGLAAPQVGRSLRLCVTNHTAGGEEPDDFRTWINPRIDSGHGEVVYEEGCLSFPGVYAKVRRFEAIDLAWQDLDGTARSGRFDFTAGDFLSIIIQHELDHLDGVLFVDHLAPVQLTLVARRLRELEKDYKAQTGKAGAVLRK